MTSNLRHALKSRFFRNMVLVVTGTGGAQVLGACLQPWLRRLYSPAEFGFFSLYLNAYTVMAIISSFRYEMAIIIPDDPEEAKRILALSTILSGLFSCAVCLLLWLFRKPVLHGLGVPPRFGLPFLLLPLSLLTTSGYRIFSNWLVRQARFRATAINKLAQRAAEGCTQLALGRALPAFGLVLGDILGNAANVAAGWTQLRTSGFAWQCPTWGQARRTLRAFAHFPVYNLVPTLLNTAALVLPVFYVNRTYGAATTGYFDLTRQVLLLSITLLGAACSQVLQHRVAGRINRRQPITRDLARVALGLAAVSGAITLGLGLFGRELFSGVFGGRWLDSGRYAQILAPSFGLRLVAAPVSIVLLVLERVRVSAAWQTAYFLAILWLGSGPGLPMEAFLHRYLRVDVLFYTAYLVLIFGACRRHDRSLAAVRP